MSSHAATGEDTQRLSPAAGGRLVTLGGAAAAVGVALCLAAFVADHQRFYFSYLVGFLFVTSTALGCLFFVLLQHLTRAGWSVAARRFAEWVASALPLCAVMILPVMVGAHDIYHHWMGGHEGDEILHKKSAWLNPTFFYVRAALYFAIWAGLAWYFASKSRKQDETGDVNLTLKMQGFSAPAMVVFALSQTFAAFDWIMSLDPHWFSTIFGVYFLSGSEVAALALMAIVTVQMQARGLFKRVSTVEHQHDIGKLLFGFTCFWAYIAFSQYFLIWYANIPEETVFFLHRGAGSWIYVSVLLVVGHFVVPFWFLVSRTTKRNRTTLTIGAAWMLLMHYVDLYWLVMPTLDTHTVHLTWIDFAGFAGPVGMLALWLSLRFKNDALYPLKDPRLEETYKVNNP